MQFLVEVLVDIKICTGPAVEVQFLVEVLVDIKICTGPAVEVIGLAPYT